MNSGQVLAHVKQLMLEGRSSFTSLWPSEVTTSAKIKLSVPVYTTNCLFPTALNKETRGTFAPLHVMFFLQNLQCPEGWNSTFDDAALEEMPSKACDRKCVIERMCSDQGSPRESRNRLVQEIGELPS